MIVIIVDTAPLFLIDIPHELHWRVIRQRVSVWLCVLRLRNSNALRHYGV